MKALHERIEANAAAANAALHRIGTEDGNRGRVVAKNDAPSWLKDLCHEAHGDMFPDDWRYEFIQDALSDLEDDAEAECRGVDDVYPYTADRLAWLSSRLDRTVYCDEAAEECGAEDADMDQRIAMGMQHEMEEVFGLVKQWLEEQATEEEDDELTAIEASNDADAMQEAGDDEAGDE